MQVNFKPAVSRFRRSSLPFLHILPNHSTLTSALPHILPPQTPLPHLPVHPPAPAPFVPISQTLAWTYPPLKPTHTLLPEWMYLSPLNIWYRKNWWCSGVRSSFALITCAFDGWNPCSFSSCCA